MRGKQKILAACDEELLGKELIDGDIEFHINERFYGGERISDNEFVRLLRECSSANLVGSNTVKLANKVYKLSNILYISGVPHAIIFKI